MRFSSYVSFDTVMGGAIFKEILHTCSQVGVQSKPNGVLPQAGYGSHVGSGVTHRYLIAKTVKPKGKCQSSQITRNYRNKNFTRSLGFLGAWCRPSGGVIVEIFSKKRTTHWKPRDWYPLQASIVVTTGSLDFQQKPRLRNICLTYKPTLIPGHSINGYRKWWALQKVFGIPLPLYGTFGFPFFESQGYTSIMVA